MYAPVEGLVSVTLPAASVEIKLGACQSALRNGGRCEVCGRKKTLPVYDLTAFFAGGAGKRRRCASKD
jgi:hypothetical protein